VGTKKWLKRLEFGVLFEKDAESEQDILSAILGDVALCADFAQYLQEIELYSLLQLYVTCDSFVCN
jgi:hypothetical protein